MRNLAAVVLAAAVALPAAAQNGLIDQARAAITREDPGTAAKLLEQAVKEDPQNAHAHYLLGEAYGKLAEKASIFRRMGLAKRTRAEFETAVQLDPNDPDTRVALLQYYTLAPAFLGGSIQRARLQAEALSKLDEVGGRRALAFIDTHLRQYDLARKELLDAVSEHPKSAQAHYALGQFYLNTDHNQSAGNAEIEKAEALDPTIKTAAK